MTRGIMALPAKQNNYEKLIKDLFKRYAIPLNRPEYKELLEQGEKASLMGSFAAMDRHFETQVLALSEAIKAEEVEAIHKKKAQERSLQIASERSLAPVRLNNSQMLMAYPWFSPDQKPRTEPHTYKSPNGETVLEVLPPPKMKDPNSGKTVEIGAAKVWDGDILMYSLSKAVKAYLETKEFPKQVEFSAYEYLRQCEKNTSGKNIENFKMSLNRLTLTQYISRLIDPVSGKEKGGETFKLCEYEWKNDKSGNLEGVIIHFSDKLFKYFATKNDLLTLKKGLLLEAWKEDRSGLRKRLLVLVGTRLGEQPLWKIGLSNLKNLCGYTNELKYFKREFLKLTPSLPWIIDIEKNKKGEQIATFTRKDE
jgi:hypothetical protein